MLVEYSQSRQDVGDVLNHKSETLIYSTVRPSMYPSIEYNGIKLNVTELLIYIAREKVHE